MDVDQPGRGGDEVGFAARFTQAGEEPNGVNRARGAADADDDSAGGGAVLQAATPNACCSSPASYISVMMSEPPTNSPLT